MRVVPLDYGTLSELRKVRQARANLAFATEPSLFEICHRRLQVGLGLFKIPPQVLHVKLSLLELGGRHTGILLFDLSHPFLSNFLFSEPVRTRLAPIKSQAAQD